MYYTIYKIINLVNNKYYIGKHQTKNLDDNYMGSGKLLKRAITKYGIENFKKEILYVFDNEKEMNAKEKELVVICEQSYNLCDGGNGGFSYINRNGLTNRSKGGKAGRKITNKKLEEKYGENWSQILSAKASKKGVIAYNEKFANEPGFAEKIRMSATKAGICALSKEARTKRKDTLASIGHQQGSKNSQFGKIWICNKSTRESKIVLKTTLIPDGWVRGRICQMKQ